MNAFKKWWENEKFKYPYRAPNEIDCGMGWNAGFKDIQQWVMGRNCTSEDILNYIEQELPNYQTDNSTKQY